MFVLAKSMWVNVEIKVPPWNLMAVVPAKSGPSKVTLEKSMIVAALPLATISPVIHGALHQSGLIAVFILIMKLVT